MVDEACDSAKENHLVMCVRYQSSEGGVQTSFLSAEDLTNKIISELDHHELNV